MLMIERRPGSSILIGTDIRIHVREIKRRNSVRIGVEAPRSVAVVRDELAAERDLEARRALPDDYHVMVVEDDPDHLEMIRRALALTGVPRVTAFSTGTEAKAAFGPRLETTHAPIVPDLVLLDLRLPDMSGVDVLTELRASPALRRVPVVVVSSSSEDENVDRCLQEGASAFIAKSTGYRSFKDSIARITEFWSHTRCVA